MSILRAMIRATTVGALRDKTWCEDRVYNSDMRPFAEATLGTAAKPYCVVYTDVDDIATVGGKAEMYDGRNRRLSVVLEIGVASAIRKENGQIVFQFAATDQGMELAVDVIESQAIAALMGDPQSQWGDLWKRFVFKVHRMQRRRGGQNERGVRFAARRVVLVCETNFDFAPGYAPPPTHPCWTFIELAEDMEDELDVAGILKKLLTETMAPEWRVAQAHLGLDKEAVEHVVPSGTPLPWPEREQPPLDYGDPSEYPPQLDDLSLEVGPVPEEIMDVTHTPQAGEQDEPKEYWPPI